MQHEQAKKLADDSLTALITALEAGPSDALKSYLTTMSNFHRYSWEMFF